VKLAILFWFYCNIDLCRNRLEILRDFNKDIRIFGLFGGLRSDAENVERSLDGLLDDFYVFDGERDEWWKWHNGDLMIADWFRKRGHCLAWDTIIVVQWDMLILGPVESVFSMLKPGEALLSGLRPLAEVAKWWMWTDVNDPEVQRDLRAFIRRLEREYNYQGDLWCCLFIVVCLPRKFLKRYVDAGPPEEGFLEYKVPTMARMFGIPLCREHPFKPWWHTYFWNRWVSPGQRVLNAAREDVSSEVLIHEAMTNGVKAFHPYRQYLSVEMARHLADGAAASSGASFCRTAHGAALLVLRTMIGISALLFKRLVHVLRLISHLSSHF
jgi:hypothetical protein